LNAEDQATSAIAVLTVTPTAVSPVVDVRTAASNVVVVVLQTPVKYERGGATTTAEDVERAGWQVKKGAVVVPILSVNLYSMPWDQDPAVAWNALPNVPYDNDRPDALPITMRHRLYLNLDSDLSEEGDGIYTITGPGGIETSLTFRERTTYCESIKVNQVGYSKLGTSRFANFGVYRGDGGSIEFSSNPKYQVYHEVTGDPVFTDGPRTATYMGADIGGEGKHSGEHVYRLSLNNVPEGGPYYVVVEKAGRSRSFGIGDAYSEMIARVTMRGLYHARCGIALTQAYTECTHAGCHKLVAYGFDSSLPQDKVDVPAGTQTDFIKGGYHDAGDMDHTLDHPNISVQMLSAYEAFPDRFRDNQYNIPESGNGIPDFLDEIMWGLKLWEHLQIRNESDPSYGGVMAGWSTLGCTGYGSENAANDRRRYGTHSITEDTTALCAGIFAHASRLMRPFDAAKADDLLLRAQQAWGYLTKPGRGIDVNQKKTRFMYAALQLFLAAPQGPQAATYHTIFKNAADQVVLKLTATVWPDEYSPGNNDPVCRTAHFISYLLANQQATGTDPAMVTNLKNRILFFANSESYEGPPPETQPYPQGVRAAGSLGLGSGTAQGRFAELWMYASLYATGTVQQSYINAVSQYGDHSLGLNAMGMSYYTGLGTDQPNSPLDCNSFFTKYGFPDGVTRLPNSTTLDNHRDGAGNPLGNVPGILVYGPLGGRMAANYETAVSNKVYPQWKDKDQWEPTALPLQRHYAHGQSLVTGNEFTTHETIMWNAIMYAFLYKP
jgi:endoglucanase